MLDIPYALFHSESGSYRWAGQNHVELFPQNTVKDLQEAIHTHIRSILLYGREAGYHIAVFEV
jgi:hypothetical protein